MIINYPTGLYNIPGPNETGNVTFLVSNTIPPRANLVFQKAPDGIIDKKRVVPVRKVRDAIGDLIYSISKSSQSVLESSSRQYEIGDVLTFDDVNAESVEPMLVGQKTEIIHNLNEFDYGSIGLSDSDAELIAETSRDIFESLSDTLNTIKRNRVDAETTIKTQQKLINDIDRNISALQVVLESSDVPGISDIIDKLQTQKTEAVAAKNAAIEQANNYAAEAVTVMNKIKTLSSVVK